MAYRVPTDEILVASIAAAIRDMEMIGSQRQFTDLVRDELHHIDPKYGITEERVRRVAINAGLVRVDVKTRDTGEILDITMCPVCSSRLKQIRGETIYRKVATIAKECPICSFSMRATRLVPVRYTFYNAYPRRPISKRDEQRTL
ncbi:MAG: hypothetical protein GX369_02865 [Euryarchaeota archaeon]|nr:hypothetical protein [Euryarchaeota archaeon]